MECDQLFVAAKEGNIATMETLIYAKYADVNCRTPYAWEKRYILQVIIYHMVAICIYMCNRSVALKA